MLIRSLCICAAALLGGTLAACHQAPAGCNCSTDTCLKFAEAGVRPVTLQGLLVTLDATGPNDQPYHPYALKLVQPLCVAGDVSIPDAAEGHDAGPTPVVQLAPKPDTPVNLIAQVGRNVAVSGKIFAASDGWHVAPVLIDVDQLAPAK